MTTICLDGRYLSSHPRGIGGYSSLLFTRLCFNFPNLEFICFVSSTFNSSQFDSFDNIRFIKIPVPIFLWDFFLLHAISAVYKPIALVCPTNTSPVLRIPFFSYPCWLTIHDVSFLRNSPSNRFRFSRSFLSRFFRRVFVPLSLKFSSFVTTVSDTASHDISRILKFEVDDILPPFVWSDREIFSDPSTDFLAVTGLDPQKRFSLLYSLYCDYRKRGGKARLHVIGINEFDAKARGFCIEGLIFHGLMPHEDVLRFFSRRCTLLFVSEHESFGIPLLEAVSFGCAVIAFDTGAVREVLSGYEPVPELDMECFVDRMLSNVPFSSRGSSIAINDLRLRFSQNAFDEKLRLIMKEFIGV